MYMILSANWGVLFVGALITRALLFWGLGSQLRSLTVSFPEAAFRLTFWDEAGARRDVSAMKHEIRGCCMARPLPTWTSKVPSILDHVAMAL